MTINNVRILNWEGNAWWSSVEARPSEPLIEASLTMTLSWNEYRQLLDSAKRGEREPTATEIKQRWDKANP